MSVVRRRDRPWLPPSAPVGRRAPDLTYASHECPPPGQLFALGVQHTATALTLLTYVLAACTIGGLSVSQTQDMVAATILTMALCTALQAWGGRLGGALLIVHIPNPIMLSLIGLAAARYGPGGMVGITLVTAVCALGSSLVLPRLRTLFPPAVAGVVICMGGLSLVGSAIEHAFDLDEAGAPNLASGLIALTTLATIAACSVWGTRMLKLSGTLLGLLAGLAVAAVSGGLSGADALAAAPILALPTLPAPAMPDAGLLIAIALVALMSQLDTLGTAVIMHKMEDSRWRRADLGAAARAMRANGIGELLLAALGPYPTSSSSANIALAHISRTTSRYVGLATALLLTLVALLPQATLAITLLPIPIIGAIELYAAAFLIVAGIELIAQRALDSRGVFMVGMALVFGMGVVVVPQIVQRAPDWLGLVAGSGMVVAGVIAIGLNQLFRLGSARRSALELGKLRSPSAITDFVEMSGAAWGARREVIARAGLAVLEAIEAIAASGEGRRALWLRGHFDEYNVDFEIVHSGPPLPLNAGAAPVLTGTLLDDEHDDALEQALAHASGSLLRHLADKVRTEAQPGQSVLRLHFEH